MLNYAEGAKEDGDKDVIDILMEETAARTHLREEYFSDYRRYPVSYTHLDVYKRQVLVGAVNEDVKIVTRLGGDGDELLVAAKVIQTTHSIYTDTSEYTMK